MADRRRLAPDLVPPGRENQVSLSYEEATALNNVIRRGTVRPLFIPRQDMSERVRFWFNFGMDTALMATLTGYKESSVVRWLHSSTQGKTK